MTMREEVREVAWRCIIDSSEVDISNPEKVRFTYTDYERLQDLITQAIEKRDEEIERLKKEADIRNDHDADAYNAFVKAGIKPDGKTTANCIESLRSKLAEAEKNEKTAKFYNEKRLENAVNYWKKQLSEAQANLAKAVEALNHILLCEGGNSPDIEQTLKEIA